MARLSVFAAAAGKRVSVPQVLVPLISESLISILKISAQSESGTLQASFQPRFSVLANLTAHVSSPCGCGTIEAHSIASRQQASSHNQAKRLDVIANAEQRLPAGLALAISPSLAPRRAATHICRELSSVTFKDME